ncbi:nucleoporin subcomplex protein binding to Pom34-domain-containing protein [Diplogelasinospora grovesii]|uniref:Nucleoporin NUP188 n=1 Tax=Diplogelasinospora grovesii TaxID=303347 RepID=A0AAN6NFQ9_9PEZI|nr:nucleoporin subcomplex protein binding to Pom34-domain-containing protein [Diplogelasinospora grovesii]
MASSTDETYFPPLEECLTGKNIILSWKLVASALTDPSGDRITSAAVSTFLKDAYVHQLIKTPAKVFQPPTAQSNAAFEAKIAGKNGSQTPSEGYDTNEIKKDAQWLSKSVNIDEIAALRIVVVEFQSRAQSHLTGPLSTQDVVNVQEAAGVSDAQASSISALLNVATVTDAEATWSDFEQEPRRRQRLLATYLSERRCFLSSADALLTFVLHNTAPGPVAVLRQSVAKSAFDHDDNNPEVTEFEKLLPRYMELLADCINRSQTGPTAVDQQLLTEQLEVDWFRTCLTEAIHAMALIFQILDLSQGIFTTSDVVAQWFKFLDAYQFLDTLNGSHDLIAELIMPLKSLACVISLKLLYVGRSIRYLDREVERGESEDPYLDSAEILEQIHNTLTAAANAGVVTASPVIFAWSLIVHRMYVGYQERAERRDLLQNQRAQDGFELENQSAGAGGRRNSAGSIVSIEQSPFDMFLVSQSLDRDLQVVERMARAVTAPGLAFDLITEMALCLGEGQIAALRPVVGARMRLILLDLLKSCYFLTKYCADPVDSLISVLSGGRQYWDLSRERFVDNPGQDVIAQMLMDPELMSNYYLQSIKRCPYEFSPFARLSRVLSTCLCTDDDVKVDEITELLVKTPHLTLEFEQGWDFLDSTWDEDTAGSFRLDEDYDLFIPSSRRLTSNEEKFTIPAGTRGIFMSDYSRVALLNYEHSALALLGKRLEVYLAADSRASRLPLLTPQEVADGISLLATVLRVVVLRAAVPGSDPSTGSEKGLDILKEASRSLPRAKDIINVVCDALDGLIQEDFVSIDGEKMAIMASCLQFLHAALAVCPGRVWAYMARCELLNSESRAGRLSRITGNLDIFAERFDFLASAVKFFSGLVDSAMTSAVQRRVGTNANGRARGDENPWLGMSDKILSRVSLSVAQTAVDVFENSATWRFLSEVDRSVLVRDVVGIMDKLITYTFSIGTPEGSNSLTSPLTSAARYIVDSFVSTSSSSLRFQPLLATLLVGYQLQDSTLYPRRYQIVCERLITVVEFSTSLLRVADYLDQPSAVIQTQLFKSASLVARLTAVSHVFKIPSLTLLSALVESAGKNNSEPPSLLGYLGPPISRSFIQMTSRLDKPFDRTPEAVGSWKFFSTVMRNRQQWMSNCLLTGKTPREALQGDGRISKLSPDSVLSTALEKLRSISTLPSQESMAILDFFTSAQNYWPWTIFAMQTDASSFLRPLRSYVRALQSPTATSKTDAREACNQARIAAYIAETFAMQLYHLRQMGQEQAFATEVINDLDYFLRDGVQVAGYNSSLHANFARNFSNRYPGCSVDDFKRTVLVPRDLGTQYYYALDFAEAMLSFDAGWLGPKQSKGFKQEMEMANLNLSLVEAEVALFHAWEYLLLELSVCLLPANATVAKQMLQVAEKCLESNQMPQPPENIFVRLSHSRANLCLTLLQRLAECSSQLPTKEAIIRPSLLMNVSGAIAEVETPFLGGREQIQYFRTLLKILFVVLRGVRHSSNNTGPDASVGVTQQVLTILDRVVARGFRTLVTLVHERDGSATTPEDLALITAILQACLSVPGIEQCEVQILNIMASYDALQVATSLFSWADRLADKGDPIYGELALLFLLELSALPAIAEQLACDGLLGHLTSANLAGFMRRNNIVSPFSENAGAARCYGIWAKGILPLLLNILGALGATIAPEVAFVLNQFPNLLRSSVERFEEPGLSRTESSGGQGQGRAGGGQQWVTLLAVSEIHSLALLTKVLGVFRMNNSRDIPEVQEWDAQAMLENVEFWLRSRKILRERLLPLGPREAEWRAQRATEGSGCENKLEEKVVMQLEAVRDVLSQELE